MNIIRAITCFRGPALLLWSTGEWSVEGWRLRFRSWRAANDYRKSLFVPPADGNPAGGSWQRPTGD